MSLIELVCVCVSIHDKRYDTFAKKKNYDKIIVIYFLLFKNKENKELRFLYKY